MARIVQKFGGTSVADVDRIKNAALKVKAAVDRGHEVAVVVSAMSGVTNSLIALTQQMGPLPDGREYDAVIATGKPVVVLLMSARPLDLKGSKPDALMNIWYPGTQGGAAVANLLFGEVSPGGKLPFKDRKSTRLNSSH